MNILLVDDDKEKVARISAELRSSAKDLDLDTAADVVSGAKALQSNTYDILLVDLYVPMRGGQRPDKSGGVKLIQEVHRQTARPRPRYIVGITAYEDVADEHTEFFANYLYGLVIYDASSDAWQRALRNLVSHVEAATREGNGEVTDLLVICALDQPELKAIQAQPLHWQAMEIPNDCTWYFAGTLSTVRGVRKVVCAGCAQTGMPAAAATTMKAILRHKPRYVAMTGIAAALTKELEFGDIVLADPSWDYGSGKIAARRKASVEFEQEPWQIRVDPIVKTQFKALAEQQGVLEGIEAGWRGPRLRKRLSFKAGPMASGAAVLAATEVARGIKKQNRKLNAIDMETYGLMFAASQAPMPSPHAFSVKSISDFANARKNDNYQEYAAYTSATLLVKWAERYL